MPTLFWIQTGTCGGDALALLSVESPSLEQLLSNYGFELLWHPSLSHAPTRRFDELIQAIGAGEQRLDILCVEGSIITAPRGTGMFDRHKAPAKMDIVRELSQAVEAVVAMGTCAADGGVHAAESNPSDCTGLQFKRAAPEGLLGVEWRSKRGLPVINVAGCPAHPHVVSQTLAWLSMGLPLSVERPRYMACKILARAVARIELNLDLNRVEGALEIRLTVEDGVVVEALTMGTMYRGLEQILVGGAACDVLVIRPSVCGICSTSHLYAAVLALEQAWGLYPPANASRVRNLCLGAEGLQSDLRHSFLFFAPDFCDPRYAERPEYARILAELDATRQWLEQSILGGDTEAWLVLPNAAGPHSWLEQGPAADAALMQSLYREEGGSAWLRQLARLRRVAYGLQHAGATLDEVALHLGEPHFEAPPTSPAAADPDGDSYGRVMAARGALGHWAKLRERVIEKYQIFTPTAWNASPRDSDGQPAHWEQSLVGLKVGDAEDSREIGHTIHSHDPCQVCTVHMMGTDQRLRYSPF